MKKKENGRIIVFTARISGCVGFAGPVFFIRPVYLPCRWGEVKDAVLGQEQYRTGSKDYKG